MDTKHLVATPVALQDDAAEGKVSAAFSIFNMVDSDQDIVLPAAFKDGQETPMVWAHDWTRPVGKGVIRVEPDRAVFDGQFFMDTPDGVNAYKTVKAMGSLQQYSWGFRVTDAEYGEQDGAQIRYIKGAEVYEVSPVLVGANNQTHTLAIKSGLSLQDDADAVLAAATRLLGRYKSLADLRAKEGRVLSATNRDRLAQQLDLHRQMADEFQGLLAATAPAKVLDDGAARRWSLLVASSMEAFGLTAD